MHLTSSNHLMALQVFLIILILLISLCLLSRVREKKKFRVEFKFPPGPTKFPILGNLHQLDKPHHYSFYLMSKKHGPLMHLLLGSKPTLVVSSANMAREFLKVHDLDCCTRPILTASHKLSYGSNDIVMGSYGESWRELRKICVLELFSIKKIESFQHVREDEMDSLVSSISSHAAAFIPVNLSEMFTSFTNQVTCTMAFGRSYEKSGKVKIIDRLHVNLSATQDILSALFVGDFVPALRWIDILRGMQQKLKKIFNDFDDFLDMVIDEHDQKIEDTEGVNDLLGALLDFQKGSCKNISRNQIKGVLMDIFLGGTETTAIVMEWVMVELMRNQKEMKKVQDEIRLVIGSKGKVEETNTYQLKYLKLVIKETLRLHPPTPLLILREVMRGFKLGEYDIEPETLLIINAWAIGRDAIFWERPEEFYPERFVDSSVDMKGHDFQLIPFGAGRRICPGMATGMVMLELVLANVLYAFNWEFLPGMRRESLCMEEMPGVVVRRKEPLQLIAKKYIHMKE